MICNPGPSIFTLCTLSYNTRGVLAILRALGLTLFTSPSLRSSLPPIFYSPLLETGPLNTANGSGKHYKLPRRGLGWDPSGNRIGCI